MSKNIDANIKTTLRNFYQRLRRNMDEGKPLWSDDEFSQGLQNVCEGLEIFILPFKEKPHAVFDFILIDDIRSAIAYVSQTIKSEGLIASPYMHTELTEQFVEPPEFTETISYILTAICHAWDVLAKTDNLAEDISKEILEIVHLCLDWIEKAHQEKEGWAPFLVESATHIYSTWSIVEAAETLKTSDFKDKAILEKKRIILDKLIPDTREWFSSFAEKQKGNKTWPADMTDFATSNPINNIYALNVLHDLELTIEDIDITTELIRNILSLWDKSKTQFFSPQNHYFYIYKPKGDKDAIDYQDSSALVVSIMVLAEVGKSLRDYLSREVFTGDVTFIQKLSASLEEMYVELKKRNYNEGLWRDASGRFSIYMTERVIEALIAYKDFVLSATRDLGGLDDRLDQISNKLDEIAARVEDVVMITSSIATRANISFDEEQSQVISNLMKTTPKRKGN